MTPDAIDRFIKANAYKMDGPAQWLGSEPNSRHKDWDSCSLRALMAASWPYDQAAGNQSIPAVWKAINDRREDYLCDRYYLPATPRDLRTFERASVPVFGVESRHQLRDFDVVGTSISYVVLLINFCKYLTMSGVPLRWRDRVPEEHPMVMIGGQAFCNPEVMAPIADCIFVGEAEDEPGNGGIGQVCRMIEMFKKEGSWNADRVSCYERLARTFNYLYFPRFVRVLYADVDAGLAELSKQPVGYSGQLDGMRMPFRKRHVIDLDTIKPLDDPPLLYVDPSLGSGDIEASRGCPAWCSFCRLCLGGETEFITSGGVRRLDECVDSSPEVWTAQGWAKARISQYGEDVLNTVTFAPAFEGWSEYAHRKGWKKTPTKFTVMHRATAHHRWPLVDGTETHHLKAGDFVQSQFVQDEVMERGWLHGMVFGDGTHENYPAQGENSNTYAVLIRSDRPDQLERFTRLQCSQRRNHGRCVQSICVTSAVRVTDKLYRVRMSSRIKLKQFPDVVCSAGYVRGFIEGWDAADGDTRWRSPERRRISSQHPEAEAWLRQNAAYGGWLLAGARAISEAETETNYGRRKHVMRQYALSRITAWKVVDIEEGSELEPVYCATVPGSFWTLATGVYTGNSYAQKPFRQHGVDYMVDFARRFQANVGGTELSPFGPDFPMQTNKNQLLKELLSVSDHIDTVAQRIDDFIGDDVYLMLQSAGGARSVTLGLEGVSQRMRDLVGKATSDAEVKEAVARGIRAGFRKFKLFMIIGLPGEDTGDVSRIMQLARDLADIRDSMAATKVTIQFSFTPLLYEAQTPFQWFSAWPVPDHDLIDVANELKQLKILFKIGVKGEPNKVHFFQLCQRASRDAGEAVIDVLEEMDQGCWGGVPKYMQKLLNVALKAHGFASGFGDLFGERGRGDMLGWEFIDTGISRDLLWGAFVKMREFAERTDSASYDDKFDERYHGNEWIDRCDERCVGNSCGVCSGKDLELRRDYLGVARRDRSVDVSAIRPVDQSTVAVRVRARLYRPEQFRYADNGFRRHLLRRAGYRAQEALGGPCVSKPAIWFASDAHGYRDWTYGADYVDFGLTRRIRRLNGSERAWLEKLADQLAPWLIVDGWEVYPATVSMRSASGASLHELEIQDDPDRVRARLGDWEASEWVRLLIRQEDSYFAAAVEEVNAKEYVDDLWVVSDGTRLLLRMLSRHRAGPYQVYQALTGKPSWIEAARYPARTLEVFTRSEGSIGTECLRCGRAIPESLMGGQWDADRCPRCKDELAGIVLAGLRQEAVT